MFFIVKERKLCCYKRNNHHMPPHTYLVGGMQLFTCLQPLNIVTRHACFSYARACDRQNSLSFWTIFCPFTPITTQKIKILKTWKKKKNALIYYHFPYVCHKWKSYDVWFLRYGAQQSEFFCRFGPSFALLPP